MSKRLQDVLADANGHLLVLHALVCHVAPQTRNGLKYLRVQRVLCKSGQYLANGVGAAPGQQKRSNRPLTVRPVLDSLLKLLA